MNPEKHYWRWALLLILGLTGVAILQVWLFWSAHAEYVHQLAPNEIINLFGFGSVAFFTFVAVLLFGLRMIFNRYVHPVQQLVEDLEALGQGAHEAALGDYPDPPASALAEGIRRLIPPTRGPNPHTEEQLRLAHADLIEQRSRADRIIESIGVPLIVCTPDGRVNRTNQAAREIPGWRNSLGQGRSLFPLIERARIDEALAGLDAQFASGERQPYWRGALRSENRNTAPGNAIATNDGAGIELRICPLLDPLDRIEELIVSIDGIRTHGPGLIVQDSAAQGVESLAPGGMAYLEMQPLSDVRFVVFDTETTGLEPGKGDEIISLAGVPVVDGHILTAEAFDTLIDPRRPIAPSSTAVHGISGDDVRGRPPIEQVLPEFHEFTNDAVLVAHNAAFDMGFLGAKEATSGIAWSQPVLCTMVLSNLLHPQQPSQTLDTLVARYGIEMLNRHTALGDAIMTAQLLLRLLPQLRQRGIVTVQDAIRASRRTPLTKAAH